MSDEIVHVDDEAPTGDASDRDPERAMDVKQMAAMLGVSAATVRRYADTGEIPSFRIGSRLRFFESAVKAHLSRPVEMFARPARTVVGKMAQEAEPFAQPRRAQRRNRF